MPTGQYDRPKTTPLEERHVLKSGVPVRDKITKTDALFALAHRIHNIDGKIGEQGHDMLDTIKNKFPALSKGESNRDELGDILSQKIPQQTEAVIYCALDEGIRDIEISIARLECLVLNVHRYVVAHIKEEFDDC